MREAVATPTAISFTFVTKCALAKQIICVAD